MTLAEGRQPIEWADIKGYPSDALDEAKALRARVAALEYALRAIAGLDAWPDNLMGDKDIARAALQQEGGE